MGFLTKAVGSREEKTVIASGGATDEEFYREWLQSNGYMGRGGAYDDYTKRSVGSGAALEASAVYACVKVIGEDTGALPFPFFRQNGNETEKARDDWRWELLNGMVNPDMSSGEFIEGMTATAALTGNAFADIERYDNGDKAVLWPRDPGTVTIIREDAPGARKGTAPRRIFYEVEGKPRSSRDLFHFRGFTFNGAQGDAILSRARRALGLYLTAQEYAGRSFSNGIHSDLFFSHPADLSDDAVLKIHKAFEEHNTGAAKAGRPFVLREAMTAQRLTPDMRKQQLHDSRVFQLLEVCRVFRIQPHKLAHLDRMTFNNVEELQIDHVVNTLGRWRKRWTEAVHRHLLTDDERRRGRYFAQHNVEALLRGNFQQQSAGWATLLTAGVYTINEVRGWLNLNPVEGGDANRVQMQMEDIRATADKLVELLAA